MSLLRGVQRSISVLQAVLNRSGVGLTTASLKTQGREGVPLHQKIFPSLREPKKSLLLCVLASWRGPKKMSPCPRLCGSVYESGRDLTQRRRDAKGEEMKKVSHTSHRDGSGQYTAQKCRGGLRTAPAGAWIQPAGIIYPDHLVTFILTIRPRIQQFGNVVKNRFSLSGFRQFGCFCGQVWIHFRSTHLSDSNCGCESLIYCVL